VKKSIKKHPNVTSHVFFAIAVLACMPAIAAHVDVSPLSPELVQKFVKQQQCVKKDSGALKLANDIDSIGSIVDGLKFGAPGSDNQKMVLLASLQDFRRTRDQIKVELSEIKSKLESTSEDEQVARWDTYTKKILERLDRMDSALVDIDTNDRNKLKSSIANLRKEWQAAKRRKEFSTPIEPMRSFSLDSHRGAKKFKTTTKLPRYMLSRAENGFQYASTDNTLMALAPSTAGWVTTCTGYTAADLAETPDAPQSPEIQKLAAELDYSASKIYQYIYNNVKFEPYYGSLKGALATLQTKAGGPTDQASLMIALLRASKIPARYVTGIAMVQDGAADPAGGRIARWVGAKSYDAAVGILESGHFYTEYVTDENATPANVGVALSQVWVEACVPYARYRGAALDNSGARWIPFDPSFKEKTYQPGMSHAQTFDYATYLNKRSNGGDSLPHEAFEKQVEAAVRALDSNAGLGDVPYAGSVDELLLDILPTSLPYAVKVFGAWPNTASPDAAKLPESHRYTLYFGGLNLANRFSVAMADIAQSRITLSFKGLTSGDQSVIDAWRGDGNNNTALPCTVRTIPNILIEGVPQALQLTANTSIGACTTDNKFNMEIGLSEFAPSTPTSSDPYAIGRVKVANYSNISAANWHALQAYAFQGSDELIASRANALIAKVNDGSNPNGSPMLVDATLGEFLHIVGLKYMRYITDAIHRIGSVMGTSGQSGNHLGLVASKTKISYVFDLPFAVSRDGFLVDVAGAEGRSVDLTTGVYSQDDVKLSAYALSAYESYVLQENVLLDAVSTVRGLQFAKETGISVLSLSSSNWSTVRPQLQVSNSASASDCTYIAGTLTYPRCVVDDPTSGIKSLVDQGYSVTLPKTLINYAGWIGPVYAAEIYVPGGYNIVMAISKLNGGWSVGPTFDANDFFDSGLAFSDYRGLPEVPSVLTVDSSNSLNNLNIFNLGGANGLVSGVTTLGGDPVNLISGNLYHSETDLSIKGRGGMHLVFQRAYNSRQPVDGPLGFGWTHNFNAKIKFYGVEGGAAKLSWIDGTGAERFFSSTAHVNGSVTLGASISSLSTLTSHPSGVFVAFSRASDGTYTIKDKSGLIYKFANVSGPNGAPGVASAVYAKLLAITDRNGNALGVSYSLAPGCGPDGTVISKVTDSIGRDLTFTSTGCHITQIKDFSGRTYKYEYTDGNNNLTAFKNPLAVAGKQNGRSYTYFSSADGQSLSHLMKALIMPRGNGMKYEYYANGRVFRHMPLDTQGVARTDQTHIFSYNDFRRETIHTNERGGESRYFFDPFGNPIKVIDPNGATRSYTYDCQDATQAPGSANCANPYNRLTETDAAGYVTTYAYDANGFGNITSITQPRGAATRMFDFNTFNQPRRIQNSRGYWTVLRYDANGNLTDKIRMSSTYTPASCASAECAYPTDASKVLAWTAMAYDSAGNLTSTKRVRNIASQIATNTALSNTGPIITFGYDGNKLNATSTKRIGIKNSDAMASDVNVATLSYDTLGRLTAGVDESWHVTQFVYDDLDRIKQASDRLGQLRDFQYDENDNQTGQFLTVPLNNFRTQVDSSASSFDDFDRVMSSMDAAGNVTSFKHDASGNVLSVTNPDNYSKTFEYDLGNHPFAVFDEQNNRASTTTDTSGRVRKVTDPNGNSVTYGYWDASRDGRLKSVTSPPTIVDDGSTETETGGRAIQFDYDAAGNVISRTQIPTAASGQSSRVTSTSYDELDRPVRVVGPQYTDGTVGAICPVTRYVYDALGAVTSVSAGYSPSPCTNSASDVLAGSGTSKQIYEYDDFSRKIKSTDGLSRSWVYAYDEHDNLSTSTDPKLQVTSYSWDVGHQLLSRTEQGGRVTSFRRNSLGQVLTLTHPEVTYTYKYDSAHRLAKITDGRGNKSLSYDWSPGGLLNRMTDTEGRTVTYVYNPVGRLAGITAPNGDSVAYLYDAGGRLLRSINSEFTGVSYRYNKDNSIDGFNNVFDTISGAPVSQHAYAYDGFGNTKVGVEFLNTYGPNGAQTASSSVYSIYSYDALDRLIEVDNETPSQLQKFTYDFVGNRLTKSVGQSSPTVTAYKYDLANQLTEIRSGSSTGPLVASLSHDANGNITNDGTRTYTWDALDQLKQVSSGGATVAYAYDGGGRRIRKVVGGTTTQWIYDGDNIAAEFGTSWTNPTAVYVHGASVDSPMQQIQVTGASTYGRATYYFANELGSIVGMANNVDFSTQTQQFDAWGIKLAGTVPQSAQYGYAGREPDETGLLYNRARYYSPNVGRFVGRDPIGLAGGLNPYAYVGNNPINRTDPSGLLPLIKSVQAFAPPDSYYSVDVAQFAPLLNPGLFEVPGFGVATQTDGGPVGGGYRINPATDMPVPPKPTSASVRMLTTIGDWLAGPSLLDLVKALVVPGKAWGDFQNSQFGGLIFNGADSNVPDNIGPGRYAGDSVPAGPTSRPTKEQQGKINEIGNRDGCHTCGTNVPGTRSGNWIGDHQDPTKLNPEGKPQRYYPQCQGCSNEQGGRIRWLPKAE
jgi:RHS repeat-associated protein